MTCACARPINYAAYFIFGKKKQKNNTDGSSHLTT